METETKPQAKKEWTKPELIVLVRSKPEEAVLSACKALGLAGDSSNSAIMCTQAGCSVCWLNGGS